MERKMRIESIVFDFDGVITPSNNVRTKTYFDIFGDIPNSKELIKESIEEDSKRDRYGIIEASLEKFKERKLKIFDDIKKETMGYVEEYNKITEKAVSEMPEIEGAGRSLKMLSQKYPLFILTGTTQKSIDVVLKNRSLQMYFRKVYGGFRDKIEGTKILIEEQRLNPENMIYIGDGVSDYECAKKFGMTFIGIMNETNDFEKRGDLFCKLYDLKKLPEIIKFIEG